MAISKAARIYDNVAITITRADGITIHIAAKEPVELAYAVTSIDGQHFSIGDITVSSVPIGLTMRLEANPVHGMTVTVQQLAREDDRHGPS